MQTNQDLSNQDEDIVALDKQAAASNDDSSVAADESEDAAFEATENDGGLANSESESDGLEKEAYINADLISEDDIADARESVSRETPMPDSNLSDPTQTENN